MDYGKRPPPDELKALFEAMVAHQAELDAHTRNIYAVLRTGQYFVPFPVSGSTTKLTLYANSLDAHAFPVPRDLTIDRLAVQVATAAAGKKVRIGIYKNGANIYPGELLLDAGEVDVGTLGVKTIIVDQALTKGLYWLAFTSDGTPGLRALFHHFSPIGLDATEFGKIYTGWYKTVTYGALPDPFPSGGGREKTTNKCFYMVFARLKSLD